MNSILKRYLMAAALPVAALLAMPAQADFIFTIDDFDTSNLYFCQDPRAGASNEYCDTVGMPDPPGAGNVGPTPIDTTNIVWNEFGDGDQEGPSGQTRTLSAERITGDNVRAEVCNNCDAGHLVAGAAGSEGNVHFIYNGPSVDVTPGPTESLDVRFVYAADQTGGVIQFTFNPGPNQVQVSETLSLTLDGDGNPSSNIDDAGIPITIVLDETNAVFNNLTDVQIDIFGVPDLDLTFNMVRTVERQIPEPATIALVGLGLAGLGFARRRRAG